MGGGVAEGVHGTQGVHGLGGAGLRRGQGRGRGVLGAVRGVGIVKLGGGCGLVRVSPAGLLSSATTGGVALFFAGAEDRFVVPGVGSLALGWWEGWVRARSRERSYGVGRAGMLADAGPESRGVCRPFPLRNPRRRR